ncbi:tRNA 2-thiouridine(34) synthase MnmA [Spiroplasma endosymbiont of Megaselia nigra]|uniref:tRNA 2-thiouridine(34) synthase MnmA n=1 Tax=Spiroplasma endosymbiont of Megaselia nigra TaxID=2478537 RepID=UPI000F8856A9|nr:tRNA 2-thiouridine(34) synthase MnmA [Spiroplasma endosymbiont of Megaselia nigra]RUO86222.1 tRNA 2-thiouridine(34) synthase MnmA [Spiroplasma endosymbiont of Megaselia nigra]
MKKVVVGLSGGVDSSVSLYLLQQAGYDVEGLFMRNWDSQLNNDILGNKAINNVICPQELDYNDAVNVSKTLQVPLHRVDFIKEYWEYVFKHFINEYQKGRTPNPDILCNKYIKFDYFLNYAINNYHADFIAMGHYAQVRFNEKLQEYQLLRVIDRDKDQTYFLSQLNQGQLSKTFFPLGNLTKKEVRKIASAQNLSTANKKDSTGICFIGERDFKNFLQNYIPNQNGNIVDIETKELVGHHNGVMYYTIGQRRGLNLGGMSEPYFVAGKNVENNILYVAKSSEEKWLYSTSCIITDVNWINTLHEKEFNCTAKFRYRQKDIPVKVTVLSDNKCLVQFATKVKAITPGQAAVFYDDEVCLGGGVINDVYLDNQKLWYL